MKITLRLPTKDQYAYIEVESEANSIEDAHLAYQDAMKLIQGVPSIGLPPKEWNLWLDTYLKTKTGDADKYAAMSAEQQRVIQEIKRSVKRITYHEEDEIYVGTGPVNE